MKTTKVFGSRIRFRLLEDIFVGNRKISKGSILYGQISGFSMQRVDLNIVSVFTKGEIFLSIFLFTMLME
jgi:exosome complex RNA-binding protein Csl4